MSKSGIGHRLKIIRDTKTQTQFAEELGIHRITLIRYEDESSPIDLKMINTICEKYNINSSWLLFGTGLEFQGKIPIEGTHVFYEGSISFSNIPTTRPLKIDQKFIERLKNEMKKVKTSPLKKERINEILNGTVPTADEIDNLSKAFGVTAIWLAEGDMPERK